MNRCYQCESDRLVAKLLPDELEVAGVVFTADLPSTVCENCGAATISAEVVGHFELVIAHQLGKLGLREGAAFRFMRKALGKRAIDLAADLETTGETISRWENNKAEVDGRAFLLLAAMVQDRLRGENSTQERIRALHERAQKPARMPLSLSAA
jgi:DNA-binding transcriptional regulator YiaG